MELTPSRVEPITGRTISLVKYETLLYFKWLSVSLSVHLERQSVPEDDRFAAEALLFSLSLFLALIM